MIKLTVPAANIYRSFLTGYILEIEYIFGRISCEIINVKKPNNNNNICEWMKETMDEIFHWHWHTFQFYWFILNNFDHILTRKNLPRAFSFKSK